MWAPVTGYASQAFGTSLLERRRGRDPHRRRRPAVLQPHRRHVHRQAAAGRRRRHHAQRQGAEGRVQRAGRARRARSPRSTRRPARSWPWSAPPRTTRAASPATPTRTPTPGRKLTDDKRPADAEPGAAPDLPARLDLQGRHRRGGAGERAVRQTSTSKTDSPLPYVLPDTTTELKNEGNIPCQQRHACGSRSRCPATPSSASSASSSARTRCWRRPRSSASTRAWLDPGRAGGQRLPREDGPAADRAVLDRPVRHRAPPRCRWRWSPPRSPTTAS